MRNAIGITICFLLILFLAGCGGGGGSSQVVQGPPSAPTGVNVVINASNELTISWNSVANATSYNIYWSTSTGANKNSTKISGITASNYVHTALVSGTTYFYVVTAINNYGEGSVSAEAFALLATPHPPGAVAAVAGNGQATVSWNTGGAATSYNIYMASQSGVTKSSTTLPNYAKYSSMTGAYTVTGLTNGTTYYFVVTSLNGFYGESSASSEVAVTPAASSTLTVSGAVKYEDKEYGIWQDVTGKWQAGFTGKTSYKAVRYAEVEAVDAASGTTIATGRTDVTDAFGSYRYTLTIPPAYSSKAIYVRAISSASSPLSSLTPLVGVRDFANALYSVAGSNFTVSGTAMANISIPTTSPAAGAFNILDVYTSGAQFVQSLSGGYPPALTAYWQTGNQKGTYFCSTPDPSCPYGAGIYILNYNGDTDEYDDDVLWHEYGHFIAAHYSKDDTPGGVHYISSNDLDLRLSWSEGWGDFFPTAVKTWLSTTTPSLLSTPTWMPTSIYVDTSSGGFQQSFDFGNPGGSPYIYASSEAAVAKVLIGLRTNKGMQAVWDTFTSIKTATLPVNLEVFWDGWYALGKPDVTAIFSERSILYSVDSYEPDDNAMSLSRKAALGVAENHTLFGGGDIDYIAFDATAGQKISVKTTALKNGADTGIRIIAPDSTVPASNDNTSGLLYANSVPNNCDPVTGVCHENGFDILGSTASFTATATGTYYVQVKSSPNRPLSAGRYGGYSLTITSP